jgi:anti-sigma factor RsiW
MKSGDDRNINLLRYLDNDLSQQELKYFSAHLETSAYCQSRLEQERGLSRFLRESRPLYLAPAELRIRVSALIESHSVRNRSRWNWWRRASPLILGWKMLVPVALVIALCLIAVPNIVQNGRAASYLETAITNHNRYLNHELSPGIRTSSPEVVATWFPWFGGKVPFSISAAEFGGGSRGNSHLQISRRKPGGISRHPSSHDGLRSSERNNQPHG